jgi:hypothetical protein
MEIFGYQQKMTGRELFLDRRSRTCPPGAPDVKVFAVERILRIQKPTFRVTGKGSSTN